MNRRQFVSALVVSSGGLAVGSDADEQAPDPTIKRVLVMFKCHFDAGFVDTQAAVVRKYFDQYFPQAIHLASTLRKSGEERYVWTTGSWLLYEYLEQASKEDRKRMEQAVANGDIAWHALPFSWQTELLDELTITGLIGLSKTLDGRFGRNTTGAKMTDVPGHSRGLIGPLADQGITFLDIGVNSASTPPNVPDVFVWQNKAGKSIVMMYHRLAYGGTVLIPTSDLAVTVEVRDDNSGPHTSEEVRRIYASLQRRFPNASIQASNLTEIANAVEFYRKSFPVVREEIGDTWIYGVASDPVKVARHREMLRLRRSWIKEKKFQAGDDTDRAFLVRAALAAEHTWGTDTKTWLDFEHYTPDALAAVLERPKYKTVTDSWVEKRDDIDQGIASLPSPLRAEAARRLAELTAVRPETNGLTRHPAPMEIDTTHFILALDGTGAITRLRGKATGREWASQSKTLAAFRYQTLSKADYDRFLSSYITVHTDWAPKDFGKPNIENYGATSHVWATRLKSCYSGEDDRVHRVVAQLAIDDGGEQSSGVTAWPAEVYLELVLPKSEAIIHCTCSWFGKRANRLPEALCFSFQPSVPHPEKWLLSKVGQDVSPLDVIAGGNRHMHAISEGLKYCDEQGCFAIETLDAPLVMLGVMSPIYFSNSQPDLSKGFHFSLFNNGWGTNYIQWFGGDTAFRFTIRA